MRTRSNQTHGFVDIHCHLIPGIDDGAADFDESLAMARLAMEDGIQTIVVTPHQMGNFRHNSAVLIRKATSKLQDFLRRQNVPLRVLPGADVRVEEDLLAQMQRGHVMTLADHGKHVLLELPHELYFDLMPLVSQLKRQGIQAILSHPERNQGLLAAPDLVANLVAQGCLMQVTCGSLIGTFGKASQRMAEFLLRGGNVHFLSTDAHGSQARRPRMASAYQRATELVGKEIAKRVCTTNPTAVAIGERVQGGTVKARRRRSWFGRRTAA